MNIKNIISLKEVSQDLKIAKEFYEKQSFGLGTYFLDSILSDIESLWLYGGIHEIVRFALFDQFAFSEHIESGVILEKYSFVV